MYLKSKMKIVSKPERLDWTAPGRQAQAQTQLTNAGTSIQADRGCIEFPLVSESPTHSTNQQVIPINSTQRHQAQQRAMSLARQLGPMPGQSIIKGRQGLRGNLTRGATIGSDVSVGGGSSGIQFPRVSGSPTPLSGHQQQQQPLGGEHVTTGGHSTLIAHQGGTQSTVPGTSGTLAISPRSWASINRRSHRDEDPNDWF